jgi:glutathione S-transferase
VVLGSDVLLYNSAVSGNCYKVRLLAAQLGLPLELVEMDVLDRSDRPDVLGGLNPALRVPTLVLDDGRALGESGAIICFLAEGTPFLPDDRYERAQVLQWLFFEQYDLEPNIAVARFWLAVSGTPERWEAELPATQEAGYRTLAAMEQHLAEHQFLVGERYTVADIALYGYTNVAEEGGFELGRFPAVGAWLARVAAQPGHIPIDG